MKNLLEKENSNIVVPIVIGAAVAAAVTYLFVTEHGKELRGQIAEGATKTWSDLQEKVPFTAEDISALKDKITDKVSSVVHGDVPAPSVPDTTA